MGTTLTSNELKLMHLGAYDTTITLNKKELSCISFNPITRNFYADDSDLNGIGIELNHKLLSCITITNPNTGQSLSFCMTEAHRDSDNDITHWVYTPTEIIRAKKLNVKSLIIIND